MVGLLCSGERLSRMAPSLLGSATCSVLYFVRTELRTMLAIAFQRSHRQGHATSRKSQGRPTIVRGNEQARRNHFCFDARRLGRFGPHP